MNYLALGDDFTRFLGEVRRIKPLPREQEYELAVRYYETGDEEAAHELVVRHLPFVVRIALHYRNYRVPLLDLVQEGIIGLMKALKRFDPYKGFRLATFAVWWIKAHIQNFIIKYWSLVKLGTTQAQRRLFQHLGRFYDECDQMPREERLKELADELGMGEDDVIEMDARLKSKELSLDAPMSDDGELILMDRVQDPSPSQEELLERQSENSALSRGVSDAIMKLDNREQFVITKRYFEDSPWTLSKIGEHFGVTRERVRQLEQRALKKLGKELQPLLEQGLVN